MKNILLFVFSILFPLLLHSQDDKIEFNDGVFTFMVINPSTKETIINKPMGKKVSVTFDTFYKSYRIVMITEDGEPSDLNLKYMQTYKDGTIRYSSENPSRVTEYYFVIDNMNKGGTLILIMEETQDLNGGGKGIYKMEITNLRK